MDDVRIVQEDCQRYFNMNTKTRFFSYQIKSRGLKLHAYTFRNEFMHMAWTYGDDPHNEYREFVDAGLDGFFTDFPATLRDYFTDVEMKWAIKKVKERPLSSLIWQFLHTGLGIYSMVRISGNR